MWIRPGADERFYWARISSKPQLRAGAGLSSSIQADLGRITNRAQAATAFAVWQPGSSYSFLGFRASQRASPA